MLNLTILHVQCTSTLDSLDLFLKQPSTQLIDNCLCGLVPFLREISIQGVGGATGCEVKQSTVKLAIGSYNKYFVYS